MELVMKSRNGRIPESLRLLAEHKLAKLQRIDPRVIRVEVEVLEERNPRVEGHRRVKVVARTPRRSFRASAAGDDAASALDQVVDRLDRQLTRYRTKFRARLMTGANRLKSGRRGRRAEPTPP